MSQDNPLSRVSPTAELKPSQRLDHWLRLKSELYLFEQVLGAVRVVEDGRYYHRLCGEEFPCHMPPGHEGEDAGWVAGNSAPPFASDLNELSVVEKVLTDNGLGRMYVRVLLTFVRPDLSEGDWDSNAVLAVTCAPPEARVAALVTTWERAKAHGQI